MAWRTWLAAGLAAMGLMSGHGALTLAGRSWQTTTYFVNTTEDRPVSPVHCAPDSLCPLRSAIQRADGRAGVVRACYDPRELPGAAGCPPGARPLRTSDRGYSAGTGRWTFELSPELGALEVLTGGVTVDFAQDVPNWRGPQDNRIVIVSRSTEHHVGLFLEAGDNQLRGFELRGQFSSAALDVRLGASNNVLGPGLVFAGIEPGGGVLIRHPETRNNRLIGSWCGVTGAGNEIDPVAGDCVRLTKGTRDNAVGGGQTAERNVLAASRIGAGVRIDAESGSGTIDNRIEGNWIGLDVLGRPVGATVGVSISQGAARTLVMANVIGGHRSDGITVDGQSFGTRIEGNWIGVGPVREEVIGNGGWGIRLRNGPIRSLIVQNRIANNAAGGVALSGALTRQNQLSENRITANRGRAVFLAAGANDGIAMPRLLQVTEAAIIGQSCAGCSVEVFSDPGEEADTFEGRAQSDRTTGLFLFEKSSRAFRHGNVTVTAHDLNGNTSALADSWRLPGRPTPKATAVPPTPTRPPGLDWHLFLVRLDRVATP